MRSTVALLGLLTMSLSGCAGGQTPGGDQSKGPLDASGRYAPTPESIITPDRVDTRIGTLQFFDGLPEAKTVDQVYDHLDFLRGVRSFLQTIPGASMVAMRRGLDEAGALPNYTVMLTEAMMDSRSLFLTANSETVYAMAWINLKGGPIAIETPPKVVGVLSDFWQRHLVETGETGPDEGKGGFYVILPPDYAGEIPRSRYVVQSPTYNVFAMFRGFLRDGNPDLARAYFRLRLKIYPLKESAKPPPNDYINFSSRAFSTVPMNDFGFFEDVNTIVQEEPADSQDPEVLGLLGSIGIEKGKKFAPDARLKATLTDAAAVGNATARTLLFAPRDESVYLYPKSQWRTPFPHGTHEFVEDGVQTLDGPASFHYYANIASPSKVVDMDGAGSQYALIVRDSEGNPLDGSKSYSLTLPRDVPVRDFWSLVVYDNQTRSMLQTEQRFPSVNNLLGDLRKNEDGSTTIFFGPNPPPEEGDRRRGRRKSRSATENPNWIQTIPGKGWNAMLRLYGARRPWFSKKWRPGEIELLALPQAEPTKDKPFMATDIPASIRTPNEVQTRIGTLEFVDGFPTVQTQKLVYENLDFVRGVDAFLTTISGASLVAMRRGLESVGVADNATVGIFRRFMDSHSLFLTGSTESVYTLTWLDLRNGAMVVKSPPNTLGVLDDAFFRSVTDLGTAGPDEGNGGLFLFTPPDYDGQISELYFAYESRTYGNLLMWRGFAGGGDPVPAVSQIETDTQIYPLEIDFDEVERQAVERSKRAAANEEVPGEQDEVVDLEDEDETRFVDLSGKAFNTIHSNDASYYRELDEMIQREPTSAFDSRTLGLLASIGMQKGKPFAPDAGMHDTLADAASVANATARALLFRPRGSDAFFYEDSNWYTAFVGGDDEFLRGGSRLLNARTMFFYVATMVTPAMVEKKVGVGSQHALAATDSSGDYLDGGKSYSLTLPANVPAKGFWSIVVYDPQTRSMLQTPRTTRPSLSSQAGTLLPNPNGSTTIFFGPEPPLGREANWIQTVPGKGWFTMLRLHGPLEPWFEKTWRPGNIVRTD